MYIYESQHQTYYDASGQQFSRRAPYLILLEKDNEMRAIVRSVALHQLGNFMMGWARIANHSMSVSGIFGNSGLTLSIDNAYIRGQKNSLAPDQQNAMTDAELSTARNAIWDAAQPLPSRVYDAWMNDEYLTLYTYGQTLYEYQELFIKPKRGVLCDGIQEFIEYLNRRGTAASKGPGWIPESQRRWLNAYDNLAETLNTNRRWLVYYDAKYRNVFAWDGVNLARSKVE